MWKKKRCTNIRLCRLFFDVGCLSLSLCVRVRVRARPTVTTRHVAVLSGNLPSPWQTALNSGEKISRKCFLNLILKTRTHAHIYPNTHYIRTQSPAISSPQFPSPHSITLSLVGAEEGLLRLLLAKSSLTCQSNASTPLEEISVCKRARTNNCTSCFSLC